jgi:hypothetical protein
MVLEKWLLKNVSIGIYGVELKVNR